jgi:hypothetical protein
MENDRLKILIQHLENSTTEKPDVQKFVAMLRARYAYLRASVDLVGVVAGHREISVRVNGNPIKILWIPRVVIGIVPALWINDPEPDGLSCDEPLRAGLTFQERLPNSMDQRSINVLATEI